MSKLAMSKAWMDLDEAADYLTEQLKENVSVERVLRFGLDNFIKLSVRFPQGTIVQRVEIKSTTPLNGHTPKLIGRMEPISEICDPLNEVCDLAMIGAEREFIANYADRYRDTPIEFVFSTSPVIIENMAGEKFCLIKRCRSNPYNQYVPATNMPESLNPVVRPEAIEELIKILFKLNPSNPTKSPEEFIHEETLKGTNRNIICYLLSENYNLKDHQIADKLNISPDKPYKTRCSNTRTNIARGKKSFYNKNK